MAAGDCVDDFEPLYTGPSPVYYSTGVEISWISSNIGHCYDIFKSKNTEVRKIIEKCGIETNISYDAPKTTFIEKYKFQADEVMEKYNVHKPGELNIYSRVTVCDFGSSNKYYGTAVTNYGKVFCFTIISCVKEKNKYGTITKNCLHHGRTMLEFAWMIADLKRKITYDEFCEKYIFDPAVNLFRLDDIEENYEYLSTRKSDMVLDTHLFLKIFLDQKF